MGVFAMLLMVFITVDNVIAPDFTGQQSLTNDGYDWVCEKVVRAERTANGDCIDTK